MATRKQIDEMAQTIRASGDRVQFVAGDASGVYDAAEEWANAGFSPASAIEWWEAGAFDARKAANMREAGLTPKQAAPLAYKYCNNDCGLQDVAKLAD